MLPPALRIVSGGLNGAGGVRQQPSHSVSYNALVVGTMELLPHKVNTIPLTV
jgi:hypothetical protein